MARHMTSLNVLKASSISQPWPHPQISKLQDRKWPRQLLLVGVLIGSTPDNRSRGCFVLGWREVRIRLNSSCGSYFYSLLSSYMRIRNKGTAWALISIDLFEKYIQNPALMFFTFTWACYCPDSVCVASTFTLPPPPLYPRPFPSIIQLSSLKRMPKHTGYSSNFTDFGMVQVLDQRFPKRESSKHKCGMPTYYFAKNFPETAWTGKKWTDPNTLLGSANGDPYFYIAKWIFEDFVDFCPYFNYLPCSRSVFPPLWRTQQLPTN